MSNYVNYVSKSVRIDHIVGFKQANQFESADIEQILRFCFNYSLYRLVCLFYFNVGRLFKETYD